MVRLSSIPRNYSLFSYGNDYTTDEKVFQVPFLAILKKMWYAVTVSWQCQLVKLFQVGQAVPRGTPRKRGEKQPEKMTAYVRNGLK